MVVFGLILVVVWIGEIVNLVVLEIVAGIFVAVIVVFPFVADSTVVIDSEGKMCSLKTLAFSQ